MLQYVGDAFGAHGIDLVFRDDLHGSGGHIQVLLGHRRGNDDRRQGAGRIGQGRRWGKQSREQYDDRKGKGEKGAVFHHQYDPFLVLRSTKAKKGIPTKEVRIPMGISTLNKRRAILSAINR